MANQMIALGVRAPQAIDLGGAATRYGNMMTQMAQRDAFKQDAANKQLEREQKQALAKAYASSINPQTGEIDQNTLIKNLQASGLGSAVPGAMEELAKTRDAGAKAKTSDLAYYKSFNDTAIEELTSALSPEQAIAAGARLKTRFPDLGDNIDELVQTIPQDPKLYEPWRQKQLFQSMQADKQLEYTMTKAKDENMLGPSGEILTVRTGSQRPVEGVVQQPMLAPRGGTGGPFEAAPAAAMSRGGGATPRANEAIATLAATNNDAEYQTALAMLERQNPQAAAQVRAIMPRFNPQQMQGLRSAAMATSAPPSRMAGNPPMVAGPRGGPDEGVPMRASSTQDGMVSNFGQPEYVSTGVPARARVPAPAQGPQPRQTPEEAAAVTTAVENAKNNALRNRPLTPAEQRIRRAALSKAYVEAQGVIDKTFDPVSGVIAAVNKVKTLSRDQREAITGWSGYVPSFTDSSRDADTAIKNLKGIVTDLGRQAAAVSGAVGPMAVQEWKILADQVAALDLENMTASKLEDQMDVIERRAANTANLIQRAFQAQFGDDILAAPQFKLKLPKPKSRGSVAAPKGEWGAARVVGD